MSTAEKLLSPEAYKLYQEEMEALEKMHNDEQQMAVIEENSVNRGIKTDYDKWNNCFADFVTKNKKLLSGE